MDMQYAKIQAKTQIIKAAMPASPSRIRWRRKSHSNLIFINMKNNTVSENILEAQGFTKSFGEGVAMQPLRKKWRVDILKSKSFGF